MDIHDELNEIRRRAGLQEQARSSTVLWQDGPFTLYQHSHTYYTIMNEDGFKVGFMTLEPAKLNLKEWEDDWLVVDNVGVHYDYQGKGLGRVLYEKILENMNPSWAGLVSDAKGRHNTKQVPHLYKSLGGQSAMDGEYWFIDNPNRG